MSRRKRKLVAILCGGEACRHAVASIVANGGMKSVEFNQMGFADEKGVYQAAADLEAIVASGATHAVVETRYVQDSSHRFIGCDLACELVDAGIEAVVYGDIPGTFPFSNRYLDQLEASFIPVVRYGADGDLIIRLTVDGQRRRRTRRAHQLFSDALALAESAQVFDVKAAAQAQRVRLPLGLFDNCKGV